MGDARLAQQLHAEARRLELVVVQHLHEPRFVLRVLQILQLVLDRRRDPLHRVAEQVQQQEALHLEADVRIDDDAQAVEDAGARRLEVAVLDHEAVLDDRRGDRPPERDQVGGRQRADQPRADELVSGRVGIGTPQVMRTSPLKIISTSATSSSATNDGKKAL